MLFRSDGTILNSLEGARRDGLVIADKVQLRQLGLAGKIEFARVGYADFAPVDGEDLSGFILAHENRLHEPSHRCSADKLPAFSVCWQRANFISAGQPVAVAGKEAIGRITEKSRNRPQDIPENAKASAQAQ